MKKTLNILHVIPNLAAKGGGPLTVCPEMGVAVATKGHSVTILATDADMEAADLEAAERLKSGPLKVKILPAIGRGRFFLSWPLYKALNEVIPTCDVVHLHGIYLFHIWAVGRLCRKHNVPYILRPHGSLDPFVYFRRRLPKKIIEFLFQARVTKGAAGIHYTASEEAELARPLVFGRPEFVVPNGIDLRKFQNLPEEGRFRTLFPELGESPYILYLGRLNFKKGLDILAKSFAALPAKHANMKLVIAGPADAGMQSKVERWLEEGGVRERAIFTGMLRGEAKLSAFRDAKIFVLPSYSENFGVSLIEAMACGLPVITTDKVNIWRELGSTGVARISAANTHEFAHALDEGLDDAVWLARARVEGPKLVERLYDWTHVADQLEAMYLAVSINTVSRTSKPVSLGKITSTNAITP
jgi:glycosyltransferase involved in cell wall biosynthesis